MAKPTPKTEMKFSANIKSDVNFKPASKKVLSEVNDVTHENAKAWMQASKASCPVEAGGRSGIAYLVYKIGGKRLRSEAGLTRGQFWRRPGTLRDSIRLLKGTQRNVISWQVHAGERILGGDPRAGKIHAYYAKFVELGTKRKPGGEKFMRKHKQRIKRRWYSTLRRQFDVRAA